MNGNGMANRVSNSAADGRMRAGFSAVVRAVVLAGLALALQSCGGRYQAPLDDQSAVLERTAPPIYSTTGPSSVGGVADSAPMSSSSTASGATVAPARAIAAGVRVQPADGVNVNVVNDPGGIRRTSIARQPLGGSAPVSPQEPAPAIAPASSPSVSSPAVGAASANAAATQAPAPLVGQSHIVARGETLYSIAWQYSLDYRALALANNLQAPYTIYPDQRLSLNIGGVSNNALQSVPAIPAAPAGTAAVASGQRPAAAEASRRTGNVPSRVIEDIAWQWPVEGRVLRTFSGSAATTSRGIDIGARRGDPVYAAADGDVVYSGRGIQGQGDLIIIRHSARHLSAYSHNSSMLVSEGARIRAGDKIAEVGTDSRGSELLHFEVRVDGAPVDPARYLPAR
ncbi:MAG: peptidoglycan DD-metalloendopeptidase family protein [Gammaproteobacteria bacterium]|nr:peptidoglycan DD-metalloendopeptidase family protein [Gammaproteobacteria bacterium]